MTTPTSPPAPTTPPVFFDEYYDDDKRSSSSRSASTVGYSSNPEIDSLRLELMKIKLELEREKLRRTKVEADLIERIPAQRVEGDLIYLDEETAVQANHPAARALKGTVPTDPSKRGAHATHIKLNYRLSKENRATLRERFPGVIWNEADYGNHDHPLAHAETLLASRQVQKKIPIGAKVLDIYGNPAANETFNISQRSRNAKKINTLVNIFTEKDAYRFATKWGPEFKDPSDPESYRWTMGTVEQAHNSGFLEEHTAFISIHTLYYLDDADIHRIVNPTKDRMPVFTCLVHRHKPMTSGFMFGGEMEYVSDLYTVTQTNVETNESYQHKSIEWLWSSKTKVRRVVYNDADGKEFLGAFTWSLEKFTETTWIVQFTACPALMDEGVKNRFANYSGKTEAERWNRVFNAANDWAENVPVPRHQIYEEVPDMRAGQVARIGALLLVAIDKGERPVKITCEPFFEHLKHQIVGKPRTADNLAGLYAVARRDTSASSYPGSNKYVVAADEVSNHVCAAFIAGVEAENLNLASVAIRAHQLKEQTALSRLAPEAMSESTSTMARQSLRFATGAARVLGKDKFATRLATLLD